MNVDPGLQTFCLIMGAAFAGLIVLAAATKYLEVRRASTWQVTTGTVTESKVRSRKKQTMDEDSHFESEPLVTYEYEVGGKRYRGTRITLGEGIPDEEILSTLARYPAGKTVQVYYDPANPEQAVLERDIPPEVSKGVGLLVVFFLGAAIGFPFAIYGIANLIAPFLPNSERAVPVTLLGGMGLFALIFAYSTQRQVWAARDWRVAKGRILDSQAEEYQTWESDEGGSHTRTMFRPSIVYSYEVNGQQFIGDRVSFGGRMGAQVAGGVPWFVKSSLAKYPEGSSVDVYYNPQNPAEAVLERRAYGMILLLLIPIVLWILAAVIAGVVP